MVIIKIKGGLGNQLFQYAAAKSLALRLGTELFFDLSFFEEERFKGIFRLDKYNIEIKLAPVKEIEKFSNKSNLNRVYWLFNKLKIYNKYYKKPYWRETELTFYLKRGKTTQESVYLDDWFANPVFFDDIRDLLISEFGLKKVSNETLSWRKEIEKSNSIAIHFRRADYLDNNYFHNLPVSYYRTAIDYVTSKLENPSFFFFSDDMVYVKKEYNDIQNAVFVDVNNKKTGYYNTFRDVEDLFLISKCKHQIIANSTFSWWGAWLNTNREKIVIAPQKWYNDLNAQKKYETGTFIPFNWIKL